MMCRLREARGSVCVIGPCIAMAVFVGCNGSAAGNGENGGSEGTNVTGGSSGARSSGGATSASGGSVTSGGSVSNGGVASSGGANGSAGASSGGANSAGANSSDAKGGFAGASGGVKGGNSGMGDAKGGSSGAANAQGGAPQSGGSSGGGRAGSGGVTSDGGGMSSGGSAGAGGANVCPTAKPLTGGKQYCSNSKGSAGGNYSYERWADGGGTGCMTVYGVDAKFSATWTNVGDFLARIGLQFDQTKTHTQLGTISAEFAETKTSNSGLVYVGIYGWTVNPLREYYILDDWGSTQPGDTSSDGTPRTHAGTISVDGDTYEVWTHTRKNKPAITGDNQTFDQYFSVRHSARQCGHISISEHFKQWEKLGLSLGKLEEAKLLVESQDSTGSIDFTTASVVVK